MTSAVTFSGVTRSFGTVAALAGVDLDIRPGEFFAMLGPSGSGKTTCLRLIAGFDQPTSGTIAIFGERADGVPPHRRAVNTVFQDYALFPHMSVIDNVAYGPKMRGIPRGERLAEAERLLDLVQLGGMAARKPQALSGGQRQRVALARALINRPKVLLLDEPLAALDLKLRVDMQGELKGLQQRLGITFVFVTHDQTEALSMADRVAVFDRGRIQQVGTPEAIYERPATPFVADFVGGANVIAPESGDSLGLPAGLWSLRAEAVRIAQAAAIAPPGTHAVPARIAAVAYQGASRRYTLEADGLTLSASAPAAEPVFAAGQIVTALVPLDALRPMVGRDG